MGLLDFMGGGDSSGAPSGGMFGGSAGGMFGGIDPTMLAALGASMINRPYNQNPVGDILPLLLQLKRQSQQQNTISQLIGKPTPNPVTVTPQVTQDASGNISRAPDAAYNQPAESYNGPLGQSMSPAMRTLVQGLPPDQGMQMLMTAVSPHKLDMVPDAQGVIHKIDSLTGQEVGTLGSPKPITLQPGESMYLPNSAEGPQQSSPSALDPAKFFKDFVAPHEGSTLVTDTNGSPVKYGINQKYWPGENVKNMTQDRAGQIFTNAYYNSTEAPKLPAPLAAAYSDTAFMAGPQAANQILQQSNGDVGQFLQQRQQYLNGLIKSDPAKYGKYQNAWNKRTQDLAQYIQGNLPTTQPTQDQSPIPGYTKVNTPPLWHTMSDQEAAAKHVLPGSQESATGEIKPMSAYNSVPVLNGNSMDAAAVRYNLTGKLPPGMGRGGYAAQEIVNRAGQLAPPGIQAGGPQAIAQWQTQNAQNYEAGTKAVTSFASGKQGDQIRFINNAVGHLDMLKDYAGALGNGNIQVLNAMKQRYSQEFGGNAPTNFETLKDLVGNEVVKSVTNSGGSAGERDAARETIDRASSPEQLAGAIATYQSVLGRQLQGLAQQYHSATGRNDFGQQFLEPDVLPYFNSSAPQASTARSAPSQADLEFTAKKYGMTVQQVKQKLGIQ